MAREAYSTPMAEIMEFDFREQILTSGGEPCNERFDDSRWNSPGLALCGYRMTD